MTLFGTQNPNIMHGFILLTLLEIKDEHGEDDGLELHDYQLEWCSQHKTKQRVTNRSSAFAELIWQIQAETESVVLTDDSILQTATGGKVGGMGGSCASNVANSQLYIFIYFPCHRPKVAHGVN